MWQTWDGLRALVEQMLVWEAEEFWVAAEHAQGGEGSRSVVQQLCCAADDLTLHCSGRQIQKADLLTKQLTET